MALRLISSYVLCWETKMRPLHVSKGQMPNEAKKCKNKTIGLYKLQLYQIEELNNYQLMADITQSQE